MQTLISGSSFLKGQAGIQKNQENRKFLRIQQCLSQQLNKLLAVPIGLHAGTFRNRFGDNIICDTIHCALHYSVKSDERPTINCNISNYDLLLLDEMSMIPKKIADHVLRTISEVIIRPGVVMACVNQQQQPIETIDRKIVHVTSIRQQKDLQPSLSSLSNEAISYNSVAIRGISSTYKILACIAKTA